MIALRFIAWAHEGHDVDTTSQNDARLIYQEGSLMMREWCLGILQLDESTGASVLGVGAAVYASPDEVAGPL